MHQRRFDILHRLIPACVLLAALMAWSSTAQAAVSPFFGPATAEPRQTDEPRQAGQPANEPASESASDLANNLVSEPGPFIRPGRAGEEAVRRPGGSPFLGVPGTSATPSPDHEPEDDAPYPAEAAQPPVLFGAGQATPDVENAKPWPTTMLWLTIQAHAAAFQRELRGHMASFARDIRENPWGRSFWLFLLAGFGYGALHALGPGHGKSFICSYFLSRKGSLLQGLALGTGSMLLHVASAAALVVALNLLLQRTGMADFDTKGVFMQQASYGLLMVLGALLTLKTLFDLASGRMARHGHCQANAKGMTAISLAAGLIPCPGSAVILIFAISLGIFWAGLASLFFVALGMGLTTSLFAVATILFRRAVERGVGTSGRLALAGYATLSLAGSLGITLLGAAMFFA